MAPLPKRRHSTRRQGKRVAAQRYHLPVLIKCPHCGKKRLSHTVCGFCGYYNQTPVLIKAEAKPRAAK